MAGRSRQISFRVDDDLAEKIGVAAVGEELATADFVRKVFRYGFREYEKVGSLHDLRSEVGDKAKRQVGMEKRVAANIEASTGEAREKRGGKRKAG